jgi:hypothetical protein
MSLHVAAQFGGRNPMSDIKLRMSHPSITIALFCSRARAPFTARPGQTAFVDPIVVFHETDEDAGQYPRLGHLVEIVVSPDLQCLGGATALFDLVEGGTQPAINHRIAARASELILGKFGDKFPQFGQQHLDVH